MKNIENRLVVFDWMRTIAISIILFHHLPDYCFNYYNLNHFGKNLDLSSLNELNRYFGLGLFVFLSGYFVNIKQVSFSNWTMVKSFWLKKILRIVPLYYLALIQFCWMNNISDFSRIGIHFLGLQLVFTQFYKPIMTLWFIGLIIIYYSLFCILNTKKIQVVYKIIIAVFFAVVSFLLSYKAKVIDDRIYLYYFVFLSGILSIKYQIFGGSWWKKIAIINYLFFPLIFSLCFFMEETQKIDIIQGSASLQNLVWTILMLSFVAWIYAICDLIYKKLQNSKIHKFIGLISYCSYGIFLFHRPVWFVSTLVLEKLSIKNNYLNGFLLVAFGIPLIVFVSYTIQKFYDRYCFPKLYGIFQN